MSGPLGKLKKLKGRSLAELRERAAQAAASFGERRGWSELSRLPSDAALFASLGASRAGAVTPSAESLLAHFRARRSPALSPAFADPLATRAELRRRFGGEAGERVTERARRAAGGRFDLLGYRDLHFGAPVDWRLEPVSGRRSPLLHWSRIDELDSGQTGDKKIVWELNRHQHLLTLGRAYWHTDDERHAETFVAHLEGWMEQNPPKLGVNWLSSLEVAFRAVAWLWALHFFRDSPRLAPQTYLRALKFLYLHARHLETYLSTYSSPNTHLTGEALGLFHLGTLLPEFRRAPRWREAGRRVLLGELGRHVGPDGVYFERTTYYHRYTADFYTHFFALSRLNGEGPGARVEEKLKALLDHLMYVTRPDGTTPLVGDDDGGRLAPLGDRAPDDFRDALSTGAALFSRADYKHVASRAAEETLWLLGPQALSEFDRLEARPPEQASRAFAEGGYYVLRDGWGADDDYMLLDCGPHGALNCGHSHADALAFDLAAGGRTLLVDPGTFAYTGSAEARDHFRGTAAHNTLTVDGESSSAPGGPFSWEHAAAASSRAWVSRPAFDFFEGEHDGYARLADPAVHRRAVLFVKGAYWVVRDRVLTRGAHRYGLHFHFAAGAAPEVESSGGAPYVRLKPTGATGLALHAFGGGGRWRAEEGWVSRCYGERTPAPVLSYEAEGEGGQEFVTFLIPLPASGRAAPRPVEVEAAGGRAFEARGPSAVDRLMLLAGSVVTAGALSSDFEWSWARTVGGELVELILLGGRRFRLGGREVFGAESAAGYAALSWGGGMVRVETDAGDFTLDLPGGGRVAVNGVQFDVEGGGPARFVGGRPEAGATAFEAAETVA